MMLSFREAQARLDVPGRHTALVCGVLIALAVAVTTGCGKKNRIGLDVDLYLYPEAASGDDLLLQTAVRKQLSENSATQKSLIHARVVDKIVFLTGTVATQEEKDAADRLAHQTIVTLNGVSLRVSDVKDNINVGG
jgi:BON domain